MPDDPILDNPNFHDLPIEERRKVLGKTYPHFTELPSTEQDKVLTHSEYSFRQKTGTLAPGKGLPDAGKINGLPDYKFQGGLSNNIADIMHPVVPENKDIPINGPETSSPLLPGNPVKDLISMAPMAASGGLGSTILKSGMNTGAKTALMSLLGIGTSEANRQTQNLTNQEQVPYSPTQSIVGGGLGALTGATSNGIPVPTGKNLLKALQFTRHPIKTSGKVLLDELIKGLTPAEEAAASTRIQGPQFPFSKPQIDRSTPSGVGPIGMPFSKYQPPTPTPEPSGVGPISMPFSKAQVSREPLTPTNEPQGKVGPVSMPFKKFDPIERIKAQQATADYTTKSNAAQNLRQKADAFKAKWEDSKIWSIYKSSWEDLESQATNAEKAAGQAKKSAGF